MADPKPGDTIICRIKEGRIVSSYAAFDSTEPLQVIAKDYWGYYVYVPDYISIEGSTLIDDYTANHLSIKSRFIDCWMVYVTQSQIVSVQTVDGCVCSRCAEFFLQAETDKDGNFTCFLCRTYRYR